MTAPDSAWKSYHDRMMKPPGIEQSLNFPSEDSDEGMDEVEDGTDMNEVEDRTDRSSENQTEEDGTEAETDEWITIDSRSSHPSRLESNQDRDSDESGDGDSTPICGGSIRDGFNNGRGVAEWDARDTPASEDTLSTAPAPRKRRINYICSETSEDEDPMEITSDGTTIFVGNPAAPLTPSRLSSSDTNDEGDIMKDAIHEVLIDGTVVYVAVTLGRPSLEATGSFGNGVSEDKDRMEDVANDNSSEADTVMYESITVRDPAGQAIPSHPPSAVRAREGLRSIPRSNYRALHQGSR